MLHNRISDRQVLALMVAIAVAAGTSRPACAVLYIYEPFNYTAGESLGGSGGTATGQAG